MFEAFECACVCFSYLHALLNFVVSVLQCMHVEMELYEVSKIAKTNSSKIYRLSTFSTKAVTFDTY